MHTSCLSRSLYCCGMIRHPWSDFFIRGHPPARRRRTRPLFSPSPAWRGSPWPPSRSIGLFLCCLSGDRNGNGWRGLGGRTAHLSSFSYRRWNKLIVHPMDTAWLVPTLLIIIMMPPLDCLPNCLGATRPAFQSGSQVVAESAEDDFQHR